MTKEEMKRLVCKTIDDYAEQIKDLAINIQLEPELGFKEKKDVCKDSRIYEKFRFGS